MPGSVRRHAFARGVAIGALLVVVTATIGQAAEVEEAEVDGTQNHVTVEQGGTTTFTVRVRATGSIRCTTTPTNPATVRLPAIWTISPTGSIGASAELTDPLPFYAGPSRGGVCDVTWPGDPAWQSVDLTVSAAPDAPLVQRTVRLRPTMFTPPGSGATLRDDTPTMLSFQVVEGSDTEPPDVTCGAPRGARGNGSWWLGDVTVDCTATDDESGLADDSDAAFSLVTSGEGVVWTGDRVVADRRGNATTVGPFGAFHVDLADPMVDVTSPAPEASYLLGSSVTARYTCEDTPDGSGVDSCDGSVDDGGSLDTSAVGRKLLRVTGMDRAGRDTDVERSYSVVYPFAWVSGPAGKGEANAGASIPIRWTLGGPSDLESLVGAWSAPCDDPSARQAARTPGASRARSVGGADHFQLVWKTDAGWAGSCRALTLALDDGTEHTLTVLFV